MSDIKTQADAILETLLSKEWNESGDALSDAIVKVIQPTAKSHTNAIYDALYAAVHDWLVCDLAGNISQEIEERVVNTHRAILLGGATARPTIDKIVFAKHEEDAEAIRAAIAKLCADEIAAARIADLEKTITRLEEELKWRRDR